MFPSKRKSQFVDIDFTKIKIDLFRRNTQADKQTRLLEYENDKVSPIYNKHAVNSR